MSLRRRIAIAAAVAVAAVAVAIAAIGYASTRSHLMGEVRTELRARAQRFLQPHNRDEGPNAGQATHGQGPGSSFLVPEPQEPGGPTGLFQVIRPAGTVAFSSGVVLPVTQRVLSIAHGRSGSAFSDAHVNDTHYEIYSAWDAPDHHVVQVALPLTSQDAVLNGLVLPYALLIGGGVLLALLLGTIISRSALSPIERFVGQTERVTSTLERPTRLEETGAAELRRLAASFNHTLDALERSIEAQRHLVADASHELRTPIASLRSNIQIFLDAARLPDHERHGLQGSILAELDDLTQIVADVVELARGSAPSPQAEPIELDTIVHDAVARAQRRAPGLHFNLELEPTVVRGVAERVSRAVTNVIDNARKWSPEDGTVDVSLRAGTLTVRDSGPGFAEGDLPHVFDRFYRAETARRMPGSGLGLAIVKQAAESHGGSAEASNAEGGGALLRVSFGPVIGDETHATDPAPVSASS